MPSERVECQILPAAAMTAAQARALVTRFSCTWRAGRPLLARRPLILATKAASSLTGSAWAAAIGMSVTPRARITTRTSFRMKKQPLQDRVDPREGCGRPPFGSPAAIPPNRVRSVALRRRVSPGLPFRGFGCLFKESDRDPKGLSAQSDQNAPKLSRPMRRLTIAVAFVLLGAVGCTEESGGDVTPDSTAPPVVPEG